MTNIFPKINIKYNRFLDPIFIFYCQNNPELKERGWNDWKPPEAPVVLDRVEKYKAEWAKDGGEIIKNVCTVLGLSFQRNIIDVHIVSGSSRGFSEPIILKSGFSPKEFVDTLVHELIHALLQDNIERVPVRILSDLFPDESTLTRNHIITHAVLKHVYIDILKDKSRLAENIERSSNADSPSYNRAWEIVDERGYLHLINEFRKKYQ
ncbi:hypothetical protein HYV30_01205 [Candidatus Kaiserbacteria bacterium]|nr:hypothetical protein [Candidatus Kaiserbacteria bacterium]